MPSDENRYPQLSEDGKRQFEAVIQAAKDEIAKAAENAIGDLYTDIGMWIESDAWANVRNHIMDSLRNYNQGSDRDNREIRKAILMENRDQIINDLNQDLVEENEKLKEDLRREREYSAQRY